MQTHPIRVADRATGRETTIQVPGRDKADAVKRAGDEGWLVAGFDAQEAERLLEARPAPAPPDADMIARGVTKGIFTAIWLAVLWGTLGVVCLGALFMILRGLASIVQH